MHLTFDHNCGKCRSILKILSLTDSHRNSLCNYCRAFHLTLTVLLHYLMELENYDCCRFQWHIACETSQFTLLDMKPPKQLKFESYDYKIRKTMQQCSEKDP